jgi:hypothetical protein
MIKETGVKKSRMDLIRLPFGTTLRKPSDITKAQEWDTQGTRKGRPRTIQRRTVLNELIPEKDSWAEVKALAANRTRWRTFTRALCFTEE